MKHIKHMMVTSNALSVILWQSCKMTISLLAVSFQHEKWLRFIFNCDCFHFLPLHPNSAFLFLHPFLLTFFSHSNLIHRPCPSRTLIRILILNVIFFHLQDSSPFKQYENCTMGFGTREKAIEILSSPRFQSKTTYPDATKFWGYLSRPLKVPLYTKIFSSLSSL